MLEMFLLLGTWLEERHIGGMCPWGKEFPTFFALHVLRDMATIVYHLFLHDVDHMIEWNTSDMPLMRHWEEL